MFRILLISKTKETRRLDWKVLGPQLGLRPTPAPTTAVRLFSGPDDVGSSVNNPADIHVRGAAKSCLCQPAEHLATKHVIKGEFNTAWVSSTKLHASQRVKGPSIRHTMMPNFYFLFKNHVSEKMSLIKIFWVQNRSTKGILCAHVSTMPVVLTAVVVKMIGQFSIKTSRHAGRGANIKRSIEMMKPLQMEVVKILI